MSKSYSRDYQGKKVRHLANGGIEITKRLGPKQAKTVHRPMQRASGGAGCFPGQTRVLTPTGWRAISTIQVAELVLSCSPSSEELVQRAVTAVKRHGPSELLAIRTGLDCEAPLLATAAHAFLTVAGTWCRAGQLKVRDELAVRGHVQERITVIRSIEPAGQTDAVFNLHTADEHNFIVESGHSGGLVAHNFSYLRALRVLMHRAFIDSAMPSAQPAAA